MLPSPAAVTTRRGETPGESRTTPLTADTPTADSPEAAFDAWWRARPPRFDQWNHYGPAPASLPTREDFERVDDTTWEWRYSDQNSIRVDVGRPFDSTSEGLQSIDHIGLIYDIGCALDDT